MRRWSILLVPAALMALASACVRAVRRRRHGAWRRPAAKQPADGPRGEARGSGGGGARAAGGEPGAATAAGVAATARKDAAVLRAPRLHPLPRLPVPRAQPRHLAGPDGPGGALHHPLYRVRLERHVGQHDEPGLELRAARPLQLPHRQPDVGRHAPAPRAGGQRDRAGPRQGADRRLRQHGHGVDATGLLH